MERPTRLVQPQDNPASILQPLPRAVQLGVPCWSPRSGIPAGRGWMISECAPSNTHETRSPGGRGWAARELPLRWLCWSPRKLSEFAGEKKRSGEAAYIFSSVGTDHRRRRRQRSLRDLVRAPLAHGGRGGGWGMVCACSEHVSATAKWEGHPGCDWVLLTSDLTFEPRRGNEIIMPLAEDTSIGLSDEPLHADNFCPQHHESASCFGMTSASIGTQSGLPAYSDFSTSATRQLRRCRQAPQPRSNVPADRHLTTRILHQAQQCMSRPRERGSNTRAHCTERAIRTEADCHRGACWRCVSVPFRWMTKSACESYNRRSIPRMSAF